MRYESIPLHKIVLPARLHRVSIDEQALVELAASIAKDGLINPISVSELNDNYQLEAGHRRMLAHQRLHRTHIDAKVYEAADQVSGAAIRFNENLQREDLSPMEEAAAIQDAVNEEGMDAEQIARMVHRSQPWVRQRLELLALDETLAEGVHQRRIGIAAALELNKVEDPEHRAYLLRYALDAGATTQTVRDWVNQWCLAKAAGDGRQAPRPEMPLEGQPIIIQIPCYVCTTPFAHEHLRILRICPRCTAAIAGVGAASHHDEPQPPATPTTTDAH